MTILQPAIETITFRLAQDDDLLDLQRLYQQLIPEESPTIEDMRRTLARISAAPEHGAVVVGSVQGKVVATCQVVLYDNLVRTPHRKAQIDSVVVDEIYRGSGFGQLLMRAAMEIVEAHHCSKIIVATSYARTGAHRLYEELGFLQTGYSYTYSVSYSA